MKKWICGNWKMNGNYEQSIKLTQEIIKYINNFKNTTIGIAPQSVYIQKISEIAKGTDLLIGAQNVHWKNNGAYTGENSSNSLKDIGCRFAIVGHSERRNVFYETDEMISKRIKGAIDNDLNIVFCIGEKLEEREKGITLEIIKNQIIKGLININSEEMKNITIAYEPIWAIGTGKVASPEQAQEVHLFIRKILVDKFGKNAKKIRILYGGSVKPENWETLNMMPDIDGALVGGASLNSEKFRKIIEISNKGELV